MNDYNLAALLISVFAPILLIFLLWISNRPRATRYRQWPFVFLAIAYDVFCIIKFPEINDWLDWLLNLPIMDIIRQWLVYGNTMVYSFKLYPVLLLNILVLLGYFILKNGGRLIGGGLGRIVAQLQNASKDDAKNGAENADIPGTKDIDIRFGFLRNFLNCFYHIDDGTGILRAKWLAVRKSMTYAALIISGIVLLLVIFAQLPLFGDFSWYPYAQVENCLDVIYAWPAVSAVVILEIIFFLGGKEINALRQTVTAPPVKTDKKVDYKPLIAEFETLFPERYAGTVNVPLYPEKKEKIDPEGVFGKALYARLLNWEKITGKMINKSVLDTILSLSDRNNTLIDTQFCNDFSECLMIYMNILLARGENLLVLCRDEETCERMRDYIELAFTRINGLTPIWIVNSSGNAYAEGDCDVLVTTPEVIIEEPVRHAQNRFLSGLSTVLLMDTNRLVSEISPLLMAVSEKISEGRSKNLQYIGLCNGIPVELQSNIELVLSPGRIFRTCECLTTDDSTHVMIWNYEPSGEGNVKKAQENLFRNSMNHVYMGVAAPIACAAVRHDVEKISIMGTNVPSEQLQDALRLGGSGMGQFFSGTIPSTQVPDHIQYQNITSDNPFIVAVDETYNLPRTIRRFGWYGGKTSAMIHVISKPYMLRNYFASQAGEYLLDKAKMDMFSVPLGDPEKNTAIRLIFEAGSEYGLKEDRLIKTIELLTGEKKTLRGALEKVYAIVRNGEPANAIESYFAVKTVPDFNRRVNDFEYKRIIGLKQPGRQILKELIGDVQPARLKIGDEEIPLGISHNNIYQYYLPDQAIVVRGRMYYIDFIDRMKGLLYAGPAIDKLDIPIDYVQHRQYDLNTENMRTERKVRSVMSLGCAEEIRAEGYEAELFRDVQISAVTLGQIVPDPAFPVPDLTVRSRYRELSPDIIAESKRIHQNGSVMSIRFTGVNEQETDRTAITISVLMSELMKTLFPYTWQCIAVCPVLHNGEQQEGDGIPYANLSLAYPQLAPTCHWNCALNTAEVLIIEDSERDSGILDALFRNRQDPLKNIFAIFRDYLKWQRTFESKENIQINADYLKFGAAEFPAYFNFSFVEDMLRQMETVHPVDAPWVDPFTVSNNCYFCHKDLRITDYVMLYDEEGKKDRKVCTECEKRLLSKKEDLIPLFEQAKEYLCSTYSITLPKSIRVKFVSAAKIAKQFKKKPHRYRYVGLAESLTNTIWVETNSPKEYILRTLVHELTHIWQFNNLKCDDLTAREGHSSFMEVRYLHDLGYNALANETAAGLRFRTDEYGQGYKMLNEALEELGENNPFNYMLEKYGKALKQ